ncbi:MAG: XRE family transcriptional regulator [Chloroflexi bacterium]|nr:XRE family transcriptional regulator [Chloroflexota bacterium]
MAEHPTPTAVAAPAVPPAAAAPLNSRREETPPDPLAVQVAGAVQRLRREAGLSERGAARALRTSQTQLRRMEDPRYLPSLRSLARVAAAYGRRLSIEFTVATAESKRPTAMPTAMPTAPVRGAPAARATAKAKDAAPRRGRARPAPKGRGTRG